MEERQVTVEGITHALPRPFTVMATQNPVEYEGTFPLPEAQLDRFLLMITLGYPTTEEELKIVGNQQSAHPIDALELVATSDDIVFMQDAAREVFVDDLVREYLVEIVQATRGHEEISLGCSPRGSIALFKAGQAMAMMRGRDFVLPDDIKELAEPVVSHRMIVTAAARMRGTTGADVVGRIVDRTPVPGAQVKGIIGR
jgi:MoxR-like ATPase